MALLKKVKSLLGLAEEGKTETSDDQGDVGVTVEREPEAETGTSDEPTGTPPETGIDEEPEIEEEPTEPEGPEVNEPPETAEPAPEQGDEPVVGADEVGDESVEDAEPDEPVAEAEPEPDEPVSEAEPEPDDDPVVEIKGIGPSYADRLGEADIETVSDLAAADADEVGDATGISPKRVEAWIDRAKGR